MLEDRDLNEFTGTFLFSISVGIASISLLFSNGANIFLQCKFSIFHENEILYGDGEDIYTVVYLFKLINIKINNIVFNEQKELKLYFNSGAVLELFPRPDRLEAYVITTKHGICPVSGM